MSQSTIPFWRHVQRKNFTKIAPLLDFLELSCESREKIFHSPRFPLNVPYRLALKMKKNCLDDPLFRQFIPLNEEKIQTSDFKIDPVCDAHFLKEKKLLHKYHGRALLLTTSACAVHCRYCFRQNFPYETEEKNFDSEIEFLKKDPSISEIILSGGDPLSLSDLALGNLLHALDQIESIQRIRFHTRFPIGIPERIDDSFLSLLQSIQKQIFFVIHTNHPIELDTDVTTALKKIQKLGIPILNQSVLLKGVNDREEILLKLSEVLTNVGVIPYYLHSLDPIQGGAHFAVSEERLSQLTRHLQTHFSGFGVPRLVQEIPQKPSKTFITY